MIFQIEAELSTLRKFNSPCNTRVSKIALLFTSHIVVPKEIHRWLLNSVLIFIDQTEIEIITPDNLDTTSISYSRNLEFTYRIEVIVMLSCSVVVPLFWDNRQYGIKHSLHAFT